MLGAREEASSRTPTCIIDGRLALSPHGLLFSLRLAQVRRAWLVRSLWSLLDNDMFFRDRPELFDDADGGAARIEMLHQWRCAWMRANLLDRFWWIGDARHESLLPADVDSEAVDRFNLLAYAFDVRLGSRKENLAPLNDCARDAVVLAAALALQSPVILTLSDGPGGRPQLCRTLRDAGIDCREVNQAQQVAALRERLLGGAMQVAAEPLFMAGLDLAAVHVLAPRALPLAGCDVVEADWSGGPLDREHDPWFGATTYWHRLG